MTYQSSTPFMPREPQVTPRKLVFYGMCAKFKRMYESLKDAVMLS